MAQASQRTVEEIMKAPVLTATASERIAEAAARMGEHRVGALVVVDGGTDGSGPGDHVQGIITERDLLGVTASGADAAAATIGEWMTVRPDTVAPGAPAEEAMAVMGEHGYRHLPVVDGGRLVGVVSIRDLLSVVQVVPSGSLLIDVPPGLKGVVVADTTVGDVRGLEGFYHYRQHSAVDLCLSRPLEDVWQLLFDGALPTTASEREAFARQVRPLQQLPQPVLDALPVIARAGGDHFAPLDGLRSAMSVLGSSLGFRPVLDIDAIQLRADALRVAASTPTLICALYRLHHGLEPIGPHPELGYAANYLYMRTGMVPEPEQAAAVEKYLISTIDHGFNASTFTARVIASTGADLGAAVVGAIGALSGPLHGGAPSRALDALDEIGEPARAAPWIRHAVERGERIMGFGHAVYKTDDPRSLMLREVARGLGGPLVDLALDVEQTVIDTLAELKPGRQLYTNVEYYAGVVMELCGLPREMFTPTFASSRVIGWCANVMEQAAEGRIIRPSARYVGPPPPQPVPEFDPGS